MAADQGTTPIWPLLVISGLFLLAGTCAYAGWWRSWAASTRRPGYTVFGTAWFGAAGLVTSLAPPLTQTTGWASRAALPAVIAIDVVGVTVAALSPFWMAKLLQPRWFRDWTAAGRPVVPAGPRSPGWFLPAAPRASAPAQDHAPGQDLGEGDTR